MNILESFGQPFFEMRCPCCDAISQTKVSSVEPAMTKCGSCGQLLARQVEMQQKPNAVKIQLVFLPVNFPVKENKKPVGNLKAVV